MPDNIHAYPEYVAKDDPNMVYDIIPITSIIKKCHVIPADPVDNIKKKVLDDTDPILVSRIFLNTLTHFPIMETEDLAVKPAHE